MTKRFSPIDYLVFILPVFFFSFLIWLMQSDILSDNNQLSFAITLDLLVTVPFVYLASIWKTKIPRTTVIPVLMLCILTGNIVLPNDSQVYLDLFTSWCLPLIELSILGFVIYKLRKAIMHFRSLNSDAFDFYDLLKKTCSEFLPAKLVTPVVTEISVIYYGFLSWRKRILLPNEFSYHKRSGTPAVFAGIIMIILIETFAVHVVLLKISYWAAWFLFALSIYSALQMIGFARSLSHRPIAINDDKVLLRYGIMQEAEILIDHIDKVELSRKRLLKELNIRKLSILGDLEPHNVIVHCNAEQSMTGLFGIRRSFCSLALHIDEPERFKDFLQSASEKTK